MTQNIEREQIIERIKKLFALSENNQNIHQAESALQKAQELVLKYGISMHEVKEEKETIEYEILILDDNDNRNNFKSKLIRTIAKYNLCKIVGKGSGNEYYLFGKKSHREMVKEIYKYLCPLTLKICDNAFADYQDQLKNYNNPLSKWYGKPVARLHGKSWKASYLLGVVSGYSSKMEEIYSHATNNSEGMAIISLEGKLVESKAEEVLGKLQNTKPIRFYADPYNKGVQIGKGLTGNKELKG